MINEYLGSAAPDDAAIYKQMRRVQSAGVTFVKYYKMLMCETPRRRVLFVHLQSNEVGRGEVFDAERAPTGCKRDQKLQRATITLF